MTKIYKILAASDWEAACAAGRFAGCGVDLQDGYIHFSCASQAGETARRHFRGREGLVLAAFEAERLGDDLRWEPSRGGELFPHLYGVLDPALALEVRPLPLNTEGWPDPGALDA